MIDSMATYGKIKSISSKAKAEADAFLASLTSNYTADHPASPEVLQKGLEGILTKHQAHSNHSSQATRVDYAVALTFMAILLGYLV